MTCRCNALCNCFIISSTTTIAEGNGSQYNPWNFRPSPVPNPRPFGYADLTNSITITPAGTPVVIRWNRSSDIIGNGNNCAVHSDGNMFEYDASNGGTKMVAPVDGLYLVGTTIGHSTSSADLTDNFFLRKNGVTTICQTSYVSNATAGAVNQLDSITTIQDLNAGDYIEVVVVRSNGAGNFSVLTYTSVDFGGFAGSSFWANWLGGPF